MTSGLNETGFTVYGAWIQYGLNYGVQVASVSQDSATCFMVQCQSGRWSHINTGMTVKVPLYYVKPNVQVQEGAIFSTMLDRPDVEGGPLRAYHAKLVHNRRVNNLGLKLTQTQANTNDQSKQLQLQPKSLSKTPQNDKTNPIASKSANNESKKIRNLSNTTKQSPKTVQKPKVRQLKQWEKEQLAAKFKFVYEIILFLTYDVDRHRMFVNDLEDNFRDSGKNWINPIVWGYRDTLALLEHFEHEFAIDYVKDEPVVTLVESLVDEVTTSHDASVILSDIQRRYTPTPPVSAIASKRTSPGSPKSGHENQIMNDTMSSSMNDVVQQNSISFYIGDYQDMQFREFKSDVKLIMDYFRTDIVTAKSFRSDISIVKRMRWVNYIINFKFQNITHEDALVKASKDYLGPEFRLVSNNKRVGYYIQSVNKRHGLQNDINKKFKYNFETKDTVTKTGAYVWKRKDKK